VYDFNRYDLDSKVAAPPDVNELKSFYDDLIADLFPATPAFRIR